MDDLTARASRQWADVLAIVTGVALVGLSLWPSMAAMAPVGEGREVRSEDLVVLARMVAAALTIAAVLLAHRWRRRALARALLIAAAAALVVGVATFRRFGAWAIATMVLPAVLLLVAATGIGPIPAPD